MEHGLVIAGLILPLLISLLGWAYQLGRSDARMSRTERDIGELRARQQKVEEDLRDDIKDGFARMYEKLDALPCHNPGWKGC